MEAERAQMHETRSQRPQVSAQRAQILPWTVLLHVAPLDLAQPILAYAYSNGHTLCHCGHLQCKAAAVDV